MSTKFKRVLFDYDGTILIHKSEEQGKLIASDLGLNEEQSEVFAHQLDYFFHNQKYFYINKKVTYGLYLTAMVHYVPCILEYGLDPEQVDIAICENNKVHSELAEGVKDTLEYLMDKGYKLCLVTNGFMKQQVDNMKHNGIFDYFECIYTWDNAYAKPDKRFIERVIAGTKPEENVLVGNDLISDIAMANKAGVFSIGFNLTNVPGLDVKPAVEIASFDTLMKIL
jgi:FMN phosphatase YigB (HAD superfamily)